MRSYRHTIAAALITFIALAALACAGQAVSKRKDAKQRDMQGKAAAPIAISYEGDTEINWGMLGDVTVFIRPERDAEALNVTVTPDARLEIIHGKQEVEFGAVAAGTEVSMKVRVMAPEEGLYYLNVLATGTFSGRVVSRSGAVPIMVSGPISPFRDASELRPVPGLEVKDGLAIMQASE